MEAKNETGSFWNGTVKVGLAAIAVTVLGWMGHATLWDDPLQFVEPEVEERITLFPVEGELAPDTTFRVRFDEPMVTADEVGAEGAKNPLVFEPPLRGKFVWDSTRSGRFFPAQDFPLNKKFSVRLRTDLVAKHDLRLHRQFHTPAMGLVRQPARLGLPADRGFYTILQFNVPVNPIEAAAFVQFRSVNGDAVPATVELSDGPRPGDPVAFPLPPTEASGCGEPESESNESVELRVTPQSPLAGGVKWQLVLRKGLPSADGVHAFAKEQRFSLGSREPFEVRVADAENTLSYGRRLNLVFNRSPDSEVDLAKWVSVEEKVGAKFVPVKLTRGMVHWRGAVLHGDFKLHREYRVRVKAGLPSSLGLPLTKGWTGKVRFRPLPSGVFLPDSRASQAVFGNREFGFVSVNNRAVRLRVKRVEIGQFASVLDAFRKNYEGVGRVNWSGAWMRENMKPVSYDLVPGREVHAKTIRPKAKTDEQLKEVFRWDDVLADAGPGALFVSLEGVGFDGRVSHSQALVQLTDIGLTWKKSDGEMFLHAFSLQDAKPIPAARVVMRDKQFGSVVTLRTDVAGICRVDLNDRNWGKGYGSRWVTVTHGGDAHTLPLGRYYTEMNLWQFGIDRGWRAPPKMRTHLFTDREIYQPGDTVRLKGHVREWADGRLAVPAGQTFLAHASDNRGHEFFRASAVEVSADGSFDLAIPLPKGASGYCLINVNGTKHHIDVFEYEPATFKLRFPGRARFSPGEAIEIPIRASYYFGKPLADAKVEWSYRRSGTPRWPTGWGGYEFGSHKDARGAHVSGEGKQDAKGELVVKPEFASSDGVPESSSLVAIVKDANGQTIAGSVKMHRDSSEFYLALKPLPRVTWANQPLQLKVVTVMANGKPGPVGTRVSATLKKVDWHSVKMRGAGGSVRFRSERRAKIVGEAGLESISADADPGPVALTPREAGEYELELTTTDAAGRKAFTSTEFYVGGEQPLTWDYENEFKMDLEPDKTAYRSGDTARLLLKTPISGRALVTVEREKVLRSFSVNVTGNAPVIDVPLEDLDAPNIYVSVLLLRGSEDSRRKIKSTEYRLGYCELKVDREGSRLKVRPTISSQDVRPGQAVEATVHVRDHAGEPMSDTEVTLYAVDEGILDLTGYKAPNLHDFFHQPSPLGVTTSTSLPIMRTEDPGRVTYANKGIIVGGGPVGVGTLRRKFLAVAFWNATLRTDADGIVRAKFTAPDSLTRYRLIAVAHTAEAFGTGETGFRINLPLMVESALPRFGRKGDTLTAKAMVYNQTGKAISAEVKLELDAHITANIETTRQIIIPANASIAVNFPLQFAQTGRARTVWRVRSVDDAALKDARESFIDIRHVAPMRREIVFRAVKENEADLLKPIDPALRQAEGTYTVGVSTSPLAELETAADYLLTYPHGCVEQTSSSLLPWLLLEDFQDVFPKFKKDADKADDAIEHGINRIFSMALPNGGLGYWPNSTSSAFGSAYAGMVLAIAQKRGHAVPKGPLDDLKKFLVRFVKRTVSDPAGWRNHCLALYALTLLDAPQAAIHEKAFVKHDELPETARVLLAMAVSNIDGPKEMIETLLNAKPKDRTKFNYYWSADQLLAMRLLARYRQDPQHPTAARLAGRMSATRSRGHWHTTFGNAWALYAFAEYSAGLDETSSVQGTVSLGDQEWAFNLNTENRGAVFVFKTKANPDELPMVLRRSGKGMLFVRVKAAMFPEAMSTEPVSQGLRLTRTYTPLNAQGKPEPKATLRVGDLVRVRLNLKVGGAGASYLAVEDGLPANLEPLNINLKTHQVPGQTSRSWRVDHQVLRKDRAVFYLNGLVTGDHQFEYLARVRAAGQATAPAAKAEAMYHPETIGLTGSRVLVTEPLHD